MLRLKNNGIIFHISKFNGKNYFFLVSSLRKRVSNEKKTTKSDWHDKSQVVFIKIYLNVKQFDFFCWVIKTVTAQRIFSHTI